MNCYLEFYVPTLYVYDRQYGKVAVEVSHMEKKLVSGEEMPKTGGSGNRGYMGCHVLKNATTESSIFILIS